ncbi:sensor histidine kinase [Flavobacterium humi]|uniref:Histidine kinase n=1 Tax=Flavobacterium humi TaxID=2562683 RepID=A0A4Z0LAC8_9FLAO|nr:sensor histidine kinase [Flavobacterium humi]TGD58892.1 histidine kinase [Flavobacterium humi]
MLEKIKQNRYFLLFIFLFGYAQSVQIRFLVRGRFSWYLFTPEAAVLYFISACILFALMRFLMQRWQKSETFDYRETLKVFSTSLLLYLIILNMLSLLIALAFDTVERNFNLNTLLNDSIGNLLNAFIYGSFFLAYYYYSKNQKNQKQLFLSNEALSESKINQLKSQLSPHFLFNNLNVLDQLIEEDKHKASDFLYEFSEIYRYVLQATDKKLVSVEDELSFAKSYFRLMQHKYGQSYQLKIIQKEKNSGYIVPLTLQLLLENAIQHNLGTESNPVLITIEIQGQLKVSNNIIEKRTVKMPSGKALVNLKEQYRLLSSQEIAIDHSKSRFAVTLPIIQNP